MSRENRNCWKEFSWLEHLTQEEILGLANYCHKRLPFVELPESNTDVLNNLVKYGVLGRTVDDGVKKVRFWQKK